MKNSFIQRPSTRREFMKTGAKGLGLVAFSQFAPAFLTKSVAAQMPGAEKDRSILVLIQLAGGNDGLNTLIPYADDNYYRLRPNLGISDPAERIALNETLALHKSCSPMAELFKEGKLSIIQNVGYPNPNRSHFRSTEIWETASDSDETKFSGWLGRYLDNDCSGKPADAAPQAIHITNEIPQTFHSDNTHNIFGTNARGSASGSKVTRDLLRELSSSGSDLPGSDNASYLQHTLMDALITEERVDKIFNNYKTRINYPETNLAQSLKRIAALIASGLETRIYYASLGGFDTHVNQRNTHTRLLNELATAMSSIQQDLESKQLDSQVCTMTFSEFGRRPSENGSQGTDHGTSAPLFVMGSTINKPITGSPPALEVEQNQDLTYSTDFRQVYATVLQKWLQCPHTETILGADYPPLQFI